MNWKLTIIQIALLGALYCGLIKILPQDVFWNTDGGNKFIIMLNLLYKGSIQIENPAADLDPSGQFFPYSSFYFIKTERGIDSIFSPYFSWIAQWFYCLSGFTGLYLISLLSGIGTLVISAYMLRDLHAPNRSGMGIMILGLCTPLFFYSMTFWEMNLVTLLVTVAFRLLVHRGDKYTTHQVLIAAGIILGLAAVFREDIYVIIIATVIAMLLLKYSWLKAVTVSAGSLLVLIPVWIWQHFYYGHWLGLHGSQYYQHNTGETTILQFLLNQCSCYYIYLLKFNSGVVSDHWYYFVLIAPFALALIAGVFINPLNRKNSAAVIFIAILTSAVACSTILTVMLWLNPEPILATIFTIGFLTASPFLVPLLLGIKTFYSGISQRLRFALLIIVLYCLGITPLLTQNDLGIVWGPRHFLYLYPLLLPLWLYAMAFLSRRKLFSINMRRIVTICAVLLVLLSLLIQVKGVANLFLMKTNMQYLNLEIAKTNEIIVSDIFWLPTVNAKQFYQKKFLQYNSGEDLNAIIKRLKEQRIKAFSIVLAKSEMYRKLNGSDLKKILTQVEICQPETVNLPGTNFMSVFIVPCKIK